jgi:hypothetical protein
VSFKALSWAFGWRLPALQKLLLLELADTTNGLNGRCDPGIGRLAIRCGMSERSVQGAVAALVDAGALVILGNHKGGKGLTRRYRLPIETTVPLACDFKGASLAPLDDDETAQDVHPKRAGKGAKSASKGCKVQHERVQNPTPKGAGGAPKGARPAPEPGRTRNEPGREPIERANGDDDDLISDIKAARPTPARTGSKKGRLRKPETPIDPAWRPDAKGISFATREGVTDVSREVGKFIDNHIAKGTLRADWPASWRSWCRNFRAFQPRASTGGGSSGARNDRPGKLDYLTDLMGGGNLDLADTGPIIDGELA